MSMYYVVVVVSLLCCWLFLHVIIEYITRYGENVHVMSHVEIEIVKWSMVYPLPNDLNCYLANFTNS